MRWHTSIVNTEHTQKAQEQWQQKMRREWQNRFDLITVYTAIMCSYKCKVLALFHFIFRFFHVGKFINHCNEFNFYFYDCGANARACPSLEYIANFLLSLFNDAFQMGLFIMCWAYALHVISLIILFFISIYKRRMTGLQSAVSGESEKHLYAPHINYKENMRSASVCTCFKWCLS